MHIYYYLFIFSFCLEAKRKNEPKKKNSLIAAMPSASQRTCLRQVHYVCFVLRTKSLPSLKNGSDYYAKRGVVLSRAKRFLPLGKNTNYRASGLIVRSTIVISVFFFSAYFSFCVAIKKKSRLR